MTTTLAMEIRPLSSVLGAEIRGVDLQRPISDALFGELKDAFLQYHVLTFREQHLTAAQQSAFARRWGAIRADGLDPDLAAPLWHTDGSWSADRPLITLLYAETLPPQGVETLFANAVMAHETLDAQACRRIEDMRAVHDLDWSHRQALGGAPSGMPPVEQPMVLTIAETGRKAIYLGQHAARIVGLDQSDGQALIHAVNAHIVLPEHLHAYHWRQGDLVMWDNRCVLHCAGGFDRPDTRALRRVTVRGERLPA
jgi:alpha-ketoglutarate-dependent taurine dioxygenase